MCFEYPSGLGLWDHFDPSSFEEDLCPDFEFWSWTHERFELISGSFLTEKYLTFLYTPVGSITSDDVLFSERYTGPKNSWIIQKKHSIIWDYVTEIMKNSLIFDRSICSLSDYQSCIMMRMYSFLGDKHIRKDIWVGSDIEEWHDDA